MEIISNEGNDKLCLERRNYDDEWSEEEKCKLMKDFGERIEYLKKDDSGSLANYGNHIWDKVFKNAPSKIGGRQPLKKLK